MTKSIGICCKPHRMQPLTLGKVYILNLLTSDMYLVVDDWGKEGGYLKIRFKLIPNKLLDLLLNTTEEK